MGSISSEIERNRTLSHIFLVRLCSIIELIEPNRSIKFDWVRLSSITEKFEQLRRGALQINLFIRGAANLISGSLGSRAFLCLQSRKGK